MVLPKDTSLHGTSWSGLGTFLALPYAFQTRRSFEWLIKVKKCIVNNAYDLDSVRKPTFCKALSFILRHVYFKTVLLFQSYTVRYQMVPESIKQVAAPLCKTQS